MHKKTPASDRSSLPRLRAGGVSPLRLFRLSRGVRQHDLAVAVGCSQVTISDLETGKNPGTPELRARVAAALGLKPPEVFPNTEPEGVDGRSK